MQACTCNVAATQTALRNLVSANTQPYKGMHAYAGGQLLRVQSWFTIQLQQTLCDNLAARWLRRAYQAETDDNAVALCGTAARCQSFQCAWLTNSSQ